MGSCSFGLCFDEGRRVGKDWVRGAMTMYESRKVTALAPMVISFSRTDLSELLRTSPLGRAQIEKIEKTLVFI